MSTRRVIVVIIAAATTAAGAAVAAPRQAAPGAERAPVPSIPSPPTSAQGAPASSETTPSDASGGAQRRTMPVPLRRILVGGPSVLFPEGTYLIRTPGRLFPESDDGLWKFLPDDFGGATPRAVPLAPSPALEQVVAITIPAEGLDVEVSGEVLAYRGGNWVLPELVVPVTRLTPRASPHALPGPAPRSTPPAARSPEDPTPSVSESSIVPRGEPPADGEDRTTGSGTAESEATAARDSESQAPAVPAPSEESNAIERMLRERIGAVAQSIEVLPAREIELPETAIGFDGVGLEGAIDTGPAAPAESLIVTRRGTIVRDNDRGGWRFISVSEDGGDPEPSMRLVPSVVLERVERTLRASDRPIPILVTGRVLRFRDERWLRLTAWELPRTGGSLRPG